MKKSNKKGFTIVELVIVIAVIAILAAVLIPTFSNLIKKANESSDIQAVRNMNTAAAIGVAGGSYTHPSDVLSALYANGFNKGKLSTYTNDYHYAYDFENNKFYLLDENDKPVFPDKNVDVSTLWGFYNNSKVDKLNGVTKYIALDAVSNQDAFNGEGGVFAGNTAYTIDLAKNVATVTGASNVTVINGSVLNDGFTTDTSIVKINAWTESYVPAETGVYSNLFFETADLFLTSLNGGETLVFDKCVFEVNSVDTFNLTATSITFKDCTFIGAEAGEYVLKFQHTTALQTVVVEGCYFESDRGINIGEDLSEELNVTIKDNTFALTATSKAKGINIAANATSVKIEGNNFAAVTEAVWIHEDYNGDGSELSFGNNTVVKGAKTVLGEAGNENLGKELASKFN